MPINHWPTAERPREKLIAKGAHSLSNAELLALLLRTGTRGKSAVDLGRDLMNHYGNLRSLFDSNIAQLTRVPGLGQAKAAQLQAILELNRRYLLEEGELAPELRDPNSTKQFLISQLRHRDREVFGCLYLDCQLRVIGFEELFQGSIDEATVHVREVVKHALMNNAKFVVAAHNHPSGLSKPSPCDIELTQVLKQALELMEIQLADHIIVGSQTVTSMAEHGLLV